MKKKFWPIFLRTTLVFFVFWGIMVGLLTWLNFKMCLEGSYETALDLWESAANGVQGWMDNPELQTEDKPAFVTDWLSGWAPLSNIGGVTFLRVYDDHHAEFARSQFMHGKFALSGTSSYNHFIHFDAVLTNQEQVALAELLREDLTLIRFYGTDSGRYHTGDTDDSYGLYGEVTGVLSGNVVYPQKLVYHFPDGPVTLLDSHHRMFDTAELTTLRFDGITLSSPLLWGDAPPSELLTLLRLAETTLDEFSGNSENYGIGFLNNGHVRAIYNTFSSNNITVSIAYAYTPWRLATHGLFPSYLLTFLAAMLLSWFVARAQARSLQRERDLTNAVAHELNTPLAVLHSYAEGLSEDIAPGKRAEYLEVIMDETDKMSALVGSLLDLSRLESGKAAFRPEPVALDEVVREVLRPLERPAEQAGAALDTDLTPCMVSGDRERLARLASNLCSNALRHCAPGGGVRVRLTAGGGSALLRVENDGEPIPGEALPRLWEPFYRLDAARSRSSGGAGLGLALVRETAQLHGGRCGAENLPGGVVFWCSLPLCQPPRSVV